MLESLARRRSVLAAADHLPVRMSHRADASSAEPFPG
jgi:hypothetical protein